MPNIYDRGQLGPPPSTANEPKDISRWDILKTKTLAELTKLARGAVGVPPSPGPQRDPALAEAPYQLVRVRDVGGKNTPAAMMYDKKSNKFYFTPEYGPYAGQPYAEMNPDAGQEETRQLAYNATYSDEMRAAMAQEREAEAEQIKAQEAAEQKTQLMRELKERLRTREGAVGRIAPKIQSMPFEAQQETLQVLDQKTPALSAALRERLSQQLP